MLKSSLFILVSLGIGCVDNKLFNWGGGGVERVNCSQEGLGILLSFLLSACTILYYLKHITFYYIHAHGSVYFFPLLLDSDLCIGAYDWPTKLSSIPQGPTGDLPVMSNRTFQPDYRSCINMFEFVTHNITTDAGAQ